MSKIDGFNLFNQNFNVGGMNPGEKFDAVKDVKEASQRKWNPDDESAVYQPTTDQAKQVTYSKPTVTKNVTKSETPALSEAAQSLLAELREKYGEDTDFVIASFSSDEEADKLMAQGTKDYTVLIDPELLERMAADEEVKNATISQIDEAKTQVNTMLEDLGEDADSVESIGISISGDGTISYFAKLKEDSDARSKQLKDDLDAKREEKKAERKEQQEKWMENAINNRRENALKAKTDDSSDDSEKVSSTIKADSISELIEKIKNAVAEKTAAPTDILEN